MTEPNLEDDKLKPGVSVVICCFNSAEVITPTITSLSNQEVPPGAGYEVILVDNNCSDDTVQLAENAWQNPTYPLKIIKEDKTGLIFARQKGVLYAGYDILLFIDDDNILNSDWVKKLTRIYKTMPGVGTAGGFNHALIQGDKPAWFDGFRTVYACGPVVGGKIQLPFGAGLSFRTAVIKEVFSSGLPLYLVGRTKNTLLRGDDTEMYLRARLMGWNFYYDSSLELQHYLLARRINWDYICRARKGGGLAGTILNMYTRLLNGGEPFSYRQFARSVLNKWKQYFKEHKWKAFLIKKEGSEASFQFYRLFGMTKALFFYRKDYGTIRRRLLEHFKN